MQAGVPFKAPRWVPDRTPPRIRSFVSALLAAKAGSHPPRARIPNPIKRAPAATPVLKRLGPGSSKLVYLPSHGGPRPRAARCLFAMVGPGRASGAELRSGTHCGHAEVRTEFCGDECYLRYRAEIKGRGLFSPPGLPRLCFGQGWWRGDPGRGGGIVAFSFVAWAVVAAAPFFSDMAYYQGFWAGLPLVPGKTRISFPASSPNPRSGFRYHLALLSTPRLQ